MKIRQEYPADYDAIHRLTDTAFAPMAFADGTAAQAIRDMRNAGDLTLSLVAEENRHVIGHVAFSPVTIDTHDGGWFGLGAGHLLRSLSAALTKWQFAPLKRRLYD